MENSLQSLARNKLIILYIIKNSNTGILEEKLSDLILHHDIMNYFLLKQYVHELEESEMIKREGESLKINQKGEMTLNLLIDNIDDDTLVVLDEILLNMTKPDSDERVLFHYISDSGLNKLYFKYDEQIELKLYSKQDFDYVEISENWKKEYKNIIESIYRLLKLKS
ncbi:MAG: DUF4364 family protein [Tissierellia bacterium]|nr:DUF4364 family protein [Tissierellia bacterium]